MVGGATVHMSKHSLSSQDHGRFVDCALGFVWCGICGVRVVCVHVYVHRHYRF